ncbi:MAG: hypothetical protein Q7K42_01090, partial [Candidatus Diapherotrites archaeon]|nr:hypothetical protein [Candidatus Diapherotrites archaeon]
MQKTISMQKEPKWLSDYREMNLEILKIMPLKKSSFFNVDDLNQLLEVKISSPKIKLPNELQEKGVKVYSLEQALEKIPEKIQKALAQEPEAKDQYEAFVNANFNTGFAIVVPKNFAEKGLQEIIVFLEENSVTKNFLFLEELAQAKILEKIQGKNAFFSEIIVLEQSSILEFGRVLEQEGSCLFYSDSILEKDAKFTNLNVYLNAEHMRTGMENVLVGQGANTIQYDLILSD